MVAGEQGVASLNQVGAPRGHNFGVWEQLDMGGPKADIGGWSSWGEGQPAPPHQLGGSGERCKLDPPAGSGPPTGFLATRLPLLAPTLFILASCNCVLSCLCLYDCNTFA